MSKTYGAFEAVKSVDLTVRPGELFTFLGPSGSGKTTILRMIAGLIPPTEGELWVAGQEVRRVPTHERNIGVVFQSLALFPHMDVYANIAFPLRMRRVGPREIEQRIKSILEVVGLPDVSERRPHELSGGQQQRIAIARALVYDPELLLLDEPFGALDVKLREEMQLEVVRLHRELGTTIINVTHDQHEALVLSDRVGVMRDGVLEQVAPSEELYQSPATTFVAQFIGQTTLLRGRVGEGPGGRHLEVAGAQRPLRAVVPPGCATGTEAALVLRAEAMDLHPAGAQAPDGHDQLPAKVTMRVFRGSTVQYEIQVAGQTAAWRVEMSPAEATFDVDTDVTVAWDPARTPVVPA